MIDDNNRVGRPLKDAQIKDSTSRFLRIVLLRDRKKLDTPSPTVSNWWRRGFIPLTEVGAVSKALNISPYLLNFVEVSNLMNKDHTWEELLEKAKLSTRDLAYIMKGLPPKR